MPGSVSEALHADEGVLLFLALGPSFGAGTNYIDGAVDPFDARSFDLVSAFLTEFLLPSDPRSRIVYPTHKASIDLRACLFAARGQYQSRMGIGIRPDCGTWFAVRAAAITTLTASAYQTLLECYPPLSTTDEGPCSSCVSRPCESACPVKAVGPTFELDACVMHRSVPSSECEHRCGAREACPVGRDFMYPREQVKYHYGVSLTMIRRWTAQKTPQ